MLLGGDEFRRTQGGNNNAYCQDNAVSWYDWGLAEANGDLVDFTRRMIAFRKQHRALCSPEFYAAGELLWFGPDGGYPNWHAGGGGLGCGIRRVGEAPSLCLLFNPAPSIILFQLPSELQGSTWQLAVDTALPSGFGGGSAGSPAIRDRCTVAERSLRVLVRQ
jgi:glycogen operon protein